MANVAFIGMGNMGQAMLKGAVSEFGADHVFFSCPRSEVGKKIQEETGACYKAENTEAAASADVVVLAVKPQVYPVVLEELSGKLTGSQFVISIAPGITTESVSEKLGGVKVVRAMPNTPASVGEGMTGICYDEALFTAEEKNVITRFFNSFGGFVSVSENLMDAITCASGSSPAYAYIFIEALADSVVKYGIKRGDAYKLAAQTLLGSAKMVLETGKTPAELKDAVCSPGGTTIQGVSALEEYGFRNAVIKATDACYKKCTEIK